MTKYKIASIGHDSDGNIVRNQLFDALSTADDGDIKRMLFTIKGMADRGEAIPAENVAVLVRAAWEAKPPRVKGRPPKGIEEQVLRLCAGVQAIKRNQRGETIDTIVDNPTPGARQRTKRDLERCMEEARNAFGEKLERWDFDENSA